eukprot:TRINITY_DN2839_c0_g1::TRINITY_DN2839_c0_g1_i1::g.5207::m.5207 TRINITY_DN2839_c0_g1::TRINITY_DN2839_c0_g1_i1::g.5207  ORF type:complete len:584 (-),score=184.22,EGF_2/PF07974.8/1.5e+04,EGF_2/PF07974.8/1.5e-05 TRINITY_DN2839_c0_g1_i1:782-2533(-)
MLKLLALSMAIVPLISAKGTEERETLDHDFGLLSSSQYEEDKEFRMATHYHSNMFMPKIGRGAGSGSGMFHGFTPPTRGVCSDAGYDEALEVLSECLFQSKIMAMCSCLYDIQFQMSTACFDDLEEEFSISSYYEPCDACTRPINARDKLSTCATVDEYCTDDYACHHQDTQYYMGTDAVRGCFAREGLTLEQIDVVVPMPDIINYCLMCPDDELCDTCADYDDDYALPAFESFQTECSTSLDTSKYDPAQDFDHAYTQAQTDSEAGKFADFCASANDDEDGDDVTCTAALLDAFATATVVEMCNHDAYSKDFLPAEAYYFPESSSTNGEDDAVSRYQVHSDDVYASGGYSHPTSFDWAAIVLGVRDACPSTSLGLTAEAFAAAVKDARDQYFGQLEAECPTIVLGEECSGHGSCDAGVCDCDSSYYGYNCSSTLAYDYVETQFIIASTLSEFSPSVRHSFRVNLADILDTLVENVIIVDTIEVDDVTRRSLLATSLEVVTQSYVSDASSALATLDGMSTAALSAQLGVTVTSATSDVVTADEQMSEDESDDSPAMMVIPLHTLHAMLHACLPLLAAYFLFSC